MTALELEKLFQKTLNLNRPTAEDFERLADALIEVASADAAFRGNVQKRLNQIGKRKRRRFDAADLDTDTARLLVADEMGSAGWSELVAGLEEPLRPMLFTYAVAAMARGDFSALESRVGGHSKFDDVIIEWHQKGFFEKEPDTLAEVFTAACMLGHEASAAYLLDHGVDPYAGTRTGLAGFHYAASSGRLNIVQLLIDRKVPMEVRNMYDGTVLGQAFWSAINEYSHDHASIIEALIRAGAQISPGTLEWWESQEMPSKTTKRRVAAALRQAQKG